MSMKGKLYLLASLLQFDAVAGNNLVLPGGIMQFQGVIIGESCSVNLLDSTMTVNMGNISSNAFKGFGSFAQPIHFKIKFDECSKDVYRNLSISFHGVEDTRIPGTLAIQENESSARGLGIALFDVNNNLIKINTKPKKFYSLNSGDSVIEYTARFRALEKDVTGGRVSGWANFSVVYQ